MLSYNETKKIKNEETDRLAREKRDKGKIEADTETVQEKENWKSSGRFVNKVIFMFIITMGIAFGAAFLILIFQKGG